MFTTFKPTAKTIVQSGIALSLVGLLSACGDGGGGGGTSSSTDSTTSTPGVIDKYIGTWKLKCDLNNLVQLRDDAGSLTNTYSVDTLTFTKTSATVANTKIVNKFYADSTCSGPVVYTITATGESTGSESFGNTEATSSLGSNLFSFDSAVTVDGAAADRFTWTLAKISNTSNAVITVGNNPKKVIDTKQGVGGIYKAIVKLNGNVITYNDNQQKDGYPTTFVGSDTTFTKQ